MAGESREVLLVDLYKVEQDVLASLLHNLLVGSFGELTHYVPHVMLDRCKDALPKLVGFVGAIVYEQLSEDVESRVAGLGIEHEWVLRFEKQCEDALKQGKLVLSVSVITDRPEERQAQIFLVGVSETGLELLHYLHHTFHVVIDLFQKCVDDYLHRLEVTDLFDDLQQAAPAVVEDVTVVDHDLVQSHHDLLLELWKLTLH